MTEENNLELLISMGFQRDQSIAALRRSNGIVQVALDLLTRGSFPEEDDAEFDLLPPTPDQPTVRPPTVFQPRVESQRLDAGKIDVEVSVSELEDSRISSLTEMGFTRQQAEAALSQTNDDLNAALNLLLGSSS